MTDRIAAAFVPLVDCAVLVAAREQGFAAAEGIDLELVKEPSWASLRDHLNLGYVDCAHALAPLPIASTLGVGHVQVDCIVPFVLGRGGNAITVSTQLFSEMQDAAHGAALDSPTAAGKALASAVAKRAAPPTLGMVFPFSSHNFDLRYWLAAFGVHPDRDVRLVAIPPPLMVESLRAGHVDGFCVGEPWNSLAVAEGLGRIVATKSQLMPHGVEKVLAVRAPVERDGERLGKLLRALAAAAEWADDAANHTELARVLASPGYLDAPADLLEAVLRGSAGSGRRPRRRRSELHLLPQARGQCAARRGRAVDLRKCCVRDIRSRAPQRNWLRRTYFALICCAVMSECTRPHRRRRCHSTDSFRPA